MTALNLVSAFAVYFIIWWIALFAVLPWGVRSQIDENAVAHGTEPGAPAKVHGWRIVFITTLVSLIVFFPLYSYWEDLLALTL